MAPISYPDTNAAALTDLVLSRLPIHFPLVDANGRDDWDVTGAALLVRATTATKALFKLDPQDSHLAAEALARGIIEVAITFAWLAASPATHLPEWIGGNDAERLKADNKTSI